MHDKLAGSQAVLLALLFAATASCALPRTVPPAPAPEEVSGEITPVEGPLTSTAPKDSAENTEAITLLRAIRRMPEHGIPLDVYKLDRIEALAAEPEEQQAALAKAWQLAATHLARGYLDQNTLKPRTEPDVAEANMYAAIQNSGAAALVSSLNLLAPQHPSYISLRRELSRQQVALAEETDPNLRSLSAARVDQLKANLERWRWLPHDLGERSVLANIASFDVTTYEHETPTHRYAAIFGQSQRQTPIFSDEIEYIVFNPWWEVPDSIARRDKLKQFQRDPDSVNRLGYQVLDRQGNIVEPSVPDWNSISPDAFPYRIRQAPGPQNALGQVKIMFPNPHSVYLHDTNDKSLFDAEQRMFSSGCVRVQNPLDLASWILQDIPEWNRAAIDTAIKTGKETRVDLLSPMPVYVVYMTAVSDSCGDVTYLQDIYNRDEAVLAGLNATPAD
jgi:murein L,D-transpeptidase YcbB/YkuD